MIWTGATHWSLPRATTPNPCLTLFSLGAHDARAVSAMDLRDRSLRAFPPAQTHQ